MFWRFGGYANISTIDTILDKPDFQLEDLLDESDLIQEVKQHNTKLIEYMREPTVLERLLEYVITPKLEPVENPEEDPQEEEKKARSRGLSFGRPRASSRATSDETDDDENEKKRNRYAYVAAEVLSSDNWSLYEALMESQRLLRDFWNFLKLPSPLDPLQASYFTKVNESLFDKKTEEMLDLLKSLDDAVPNMLRHVDCPMIMDLLLKIISLERTENGQGIVEWLYTKDVMPTLLSFLGPEHNYAAQTSAGDFIKAIITVSANASQNEQACIGPNELTRQLVSKACVQKLIGYMLGGGNALTVGVGIVIEVIRKNNSDYDPDVGPDSNALPSSRDPIYLGTLLRLFADHVPDFMSLILNAPAQKQRLDSTFGGKIEPLGFDRFKTCELMAELLHCSNMALLNEVGSEHIIALRDEERQRLRAEGRLATNRGEEVQSTEDLTMRMRHSSPDDGRRLEITNASDDDGFEEVNPLSDMTEDTSHEFIKAEDEIPIAPVPSFLEKEDDDFVEEPLSSPRLNVQDSKLAEQQFENPELVVPPLSPKKPVAVPQLAQPLDAPLTSDSKDSSQSSLPTASARQAEVATQVEVQDIIELEGREVFPTTSEGPSATSRETGGSAGFTVHVVESIPPLPTTETPTVVTNPTETEPSMPAGVPSQQPTTTTTATASTITNSKPDGAVIVDAHPQPGLTPPGVREQFTPVVGDYLKMQFVEHRVVPTILSFFFRYPWNNFLHNVVYDIVQQVFNGPMDRGYNPTLAISLFEAADITNAVINGQASSEQSQAQSKTRMGYMGHLTLIAEEVVKFTERNPPELLSELVLDRVMSQDWINYVEGALAETRERDNAILGGVRPDVALNNRAQMAGNGLGGMGLSGLGLGGAPMGGSHVLVEAGLNGGGGMEIQENGSGSSLGPFSISSGLLSGSGFGSSSDEDEDDAEDTEEDVNNEFRAYTDPLHAASSSMDPPSVPPPPPPPPPLNIPPSRARLQFAARLAMQQKNAAAASAQSAENENSRGSDDNAADRETSSVLRNPFEDDGEDDVDDDSDDGLGDDDNTDSWGAGPSRGGWWRGALRSGGEKFGDGRDDSDSDKDVPTGGDEDDEEFGDFAMPEVDKEKGNDTSGVIVKPLAVHPPPPSQKTSAFTSLWPFGSKDREKQKAKEGEELKAENLSEITGEDGEKIKSTHEAARRTSIEDPDDEEVVV
ncbi:SAPS-domain-containing protein [Durotheca rogersii]|uniref:SAPS-domain-containing protein n=1 Tax=Durotheca rogersii TaxID=419775 RepID=UPI00222028CA|nr:SAPS-domain-containing protein [Durotheca rogersii]KAI5864133.1 SAPS-domain-containing protein [Durotheca rogersii]